MIQKHANGFLSTPKIVQNVSHPSRKMVDAITWAVKQQLAYINFVGCAWRNGVVATTIVTSRFLLISSFEHEIEWFQRSVNDKSKFRFCHFLKKKIKWIWFHSPLMQGGRENKEIYFWDFLTFRICFLFPKQFKSSVILSRPRKFEKLGYFFKVFKS